MVSSIEDILDHIKSDKVKDRQEGLSNLRHTFRTDKSIARYHLDKAGRADPKKWLVIFQALFSLVLREKEAYLKKAASGARADAVAGRLREAATAVRWLVEKCAQHMNKRVVNAVFDHLTQVMIRRGELTPMIAFEYIQALKFLVNWPPHLEHMSDDLWVRIVELGFNVVLCDPLRRHFEDDEEEKEDNNESSEEEISSPRKGKDGSPSTTRKRSHGAQDTQTKTRQQRSSTPASAPPTQEQIVFMSLLVILLGSDSNPLLLPEYSFLPKSVLNRLQRFLEFYPSETSLHHDYLLLLSSTLSFLSLNKRSVVESFAHMAWCSLVGLWGTKSKIMKENLTIVLKTLFPFITSEQPTSGFDVSDGLQRLWRSLNGEADSRWGLDVLTFEALRMELVSEEQIQGSQLGTLPFTSKSFRHGWHFDAGQALAWVILELHADCTEKLYRCSESMQSATAQSAHPSKRQRVENPVKTLLHSLKSLHSTNVTHIYHLQVLLFVIERHWMALHFGLRRHVMHTLQQRITIDNPAVQSWVFVCLASVAFAEGSLDSPSSSVNSSVMDSDELAEDEASQEAFSWEIVWAHAIRRSSNPAACRAACHVAHTLLLFSPLQLTAQTTSLLSPQRVLREVETLARDLDVQGPSFPFDSVCAFLALCLKTARQDARLYRMQLEDKVLNWLVDAWKFVGSAGLGHFKSFSTKQDQGRMPLHNIQDILALLETICMLRHKSNLICRLTLPSCPIVEAAIMEGKCCIIREFLLNARILDDPKNERIALSTDPTSANEPGETKADLLAPSSREHKASMILIKLAEELTSEWETMKENSAHPSAEKARRLLDMVVIGLCFETLLAWNGTRSNRRLIQHSCKLAGYILAYLPESNWTVEEKAFVLHGVEPMVASSDSHDPYDGRWQALLPPDKHSGLRHSVSQNLRSRHLGRLSSKVTERCLLQRNLWKSADVQDAFSPIMQVLRRVLRESADSVSDAAPTTSGFEDGFDTIRGTQHSQASRSETEHGLNALLQVSFAIVIQAPVLQTSSGEPTRDSDLVELILGYEEESTESFLLLSRAIVYRLHRKSIILTVNQFERFLEAFGDLLQHYKYSRNTGLQLLIASFLDSTYEIWFDSAVAKSETGCNVRQLCDWFSENLRSHKIRSWRARDHLACFMDRHVRRDPTLALWSVAGEGKDEEDRLAKFPTRLLPSLGGDPDIRVRFRAALINANMFSLAQQVGFSLNDLYLDMIKYFTKDTLNYEHMLTRLISLGNIMVISASVRRGPYWHLLEVCLYNTEYGRHIESLLLHVSKSLGFQKLSMLFEAYASQIAHSIRDVGQDFLRFPPRILGYNDRVQCAKAAFRAFTPTNLLSTDEHAEAIAHGEKLFAAHCKVIGMETQDGITQCFGTIVGWQIVTTVSSAEERQISNLLDLLISRTTPKGDRTIFVERLAQNADSIVCTILRTLGDQDCSLNGPIVSTLRSRDPSGDIATAFQTMTCFRPTAEEHSSSLNYPSFPTSVVLASLEWFFEVVPHAKGQGLVYHVLHQIFADVQTFPLVDEQIRLLTSISLWVAMNWHEFGNSALLHTLVHGTLLSLGESDLLHAAQSILHWAFSTRSHSLEEIRLPDILIRACHTAHEYTLHAETSEMGKQLLRWVNEWTMSFYRTPSSRPHILKALIVWPDQDFADSLEQEATPDIVCDVLEHESISSNKFRLARRLHELTVNGQYDPEQFATIGFWKLKECIPAIRNSIHEEDVAAFAALLTSNKGSIKSFGKDPHTLSGSKSRYLRRDKRVHASNTRGRHSSEAIIISILISLLESEKADEVHGAYITLRLLVSVWDHHIMDSAVLSPDCRAELDLLAVYPLPAEARPARNLQELDSPAFDLASTSNFSQWIADLTVLMSDILSQREVLFAQLASLLKNDPAFADQMLPLLIHTLLLSDDNDFTSRTLVSRYFESVLSFDAADIACSRCIIDVVLHLRHHRHHKIQGELGYNQWLRVDFTKLARKAVQCGSYTTALLFLELVMDNRDCSPVDEKLSEEIMFDIYSHIDEPDGFYGVKTHDFQKFLFKRFYHEKQWEKAFRFHGAALESGRVEAQDTAGLLQSFHSFGFNRLAMDTLQQASANDSTALPTVTYQLGWRAETWDLPNVSEELEHDSSLYFALRAMHRERDHNTATHAVRRALSYELSYLRSLGNENLAEIRNVGRNLMCLSQIFSWTGDEIQSCLRSSSLESRDWSEFESISSDFNFDDLETIMATRVSLVRSVRLKEERERIGNLQSNFALDLIDIEKKCLIRLSEAAREANMLQIALNSIIRSQRLETSPSFEVMQEFANVLWAQSERKMALQTLKQIVLGEESDGFISDKQGKATLLARMGAWASEACLEKPTDIISSFFNPAIALISSDSTIPPHAGIYHQYAVFMEQQYQTIVKSPDTVRWKLYMDRKSQELSRRSIQIKSLKQGTHERHNLDNEQAKAQRQLKSDKESFNKHNSALNESLHRAIEMYSRCLEASDEHDDEVPIRFCSLWFANFGNALVQETVGNALGRIPSRKFVFLAHQLTARLSKPTAETVPTNQEHLQDLILRMCLEHPFHSLYQVYCLQPDQALASNRRQSSQLDITSSQAERGAAASQLLSRLRYDPSNGERVRAVEQVCIAYLQWAKHPITQDSRYKRKPGDTTLFKTPGNMLIMKLSNTKVPIPTIRTALDPSLLYEGCICIEKYDSLFDTAGGVNLPKISYCVGTDGEKYKQLFKGEGNDDLRQDAVMEQVFDLVNRILRRDRKTRSRDLRIRGYTVIPLASQAGVLEFVANTTPLAQWVNNAHTRYYPEDFRPGVAKEMMAKRRKEPKENRIALFLNIRTKFKPVMRHYFTERHKTPMGWFAMRLCYTRSVATTSIVGHITGLGDRHVSNILLDNVNGEVVHIDLGIAFDQGKLLPEPERVPFRMTADMVDGMGSSGTQGVFQRCAEETLRVMREGSQVMMTVLEVFKHDPLHSWTASEVKVNKLQPSVRDQATVNDFRLIDIDMTSGTAEEGADRALSSVARKLDKTMTVEFTVNELIAEATDIGNLATIYHGWAPYL